MDATYEEDDSSMTRPMPSRISTRHQIGQIHRPPGQLLLTGQIAFCSARHIPPSFQGLRI